MTWFEQWLKMFAWQLNLNKSFSPSYVEQTLFKVQDLVQSLTSSKQALKLESMAVLGARKFAKSGLTETELSIS